MRDTSRFLIGLTAVLAAYYAMYLWLGARVPLSDGLGWDGRIYGAFAQDFFGELSRSGVSSYSANRLLPSLLVWSATALAGIRLSDAAAIVTAFHIYNVILLIGMGLVWARISSTLCLRREIAVIGFFSLFVNWAVLKQFGYFAVQTDATALFLGALVALATIERRWSLLSATALVSSFVWNTVFPLCALLVLFPKPALVPSERNWLPWIAAAVAVVLALATTLSGFQLIAGASQISFTALPLSIAALGAYVYFVARNFPTVSLLRSLRLGAPAPVALFGATWLISGLALAAFRHQFATGADPIDMHTQLVGFLATAVAKPAVFLLAHISFFGPAILLILLALSSVVKAATSHSAGIALFAVAALAMMLNSESRFLTFAYPMLVTLLCLAFRDLTLRPAMVAGYLAASLLLSKVYLPLGLLGFPELRRAEDLQTFPHQWVFMNIGPWMGWGGYLLNLACIAAALGIGAIAWRRIR